MILKDGQKWACRSCITGHRSSKCTHQERELFPIAKKGRPSSHCKVCREAGLSGSSNEPAPPGCTCQAKRRARSQQGSAPGSISPDNVGGPGTTTANTTGTDNSANASLGTPDSGLMYGSSKRRKNSDGSASIYSFDDRRSSNSYASSYSASSEYGHPESNSAPSSATSSPAQQHQFTSHRIPYYSQYPPQDVETRPLPHFTPSNINPPAAATAGYPQQPMLSPVFATQEAQHHQLPFADVTSAMGTAYQPRAPTAEDLPWWMYRTGLTPDVQPSHTLPAESGGLQQLVHNNTYGFADLAQSVAAPSALYPESANSAAELHAHPSWQHNIFPSHAYQQLSDSAPQSQAGFQYHTSAVHSSPSHGSLEHHQQYHPQEFRHPQVKVEQGQRSDFGQYPLHQHVFQEQWHGGHDASASAHYASNLTETPATWGDNVHAGYYPSQPTVRPKTSRSGTPALTMAGGSEGSSIRTNSSESATNAIIDARPNLVDIAAQHNSAPGYIHIGQEGSGVGNMTGDTGSFFARAGLVMDLKLPDKKRKISTEW